MIFLRKKQTVVRINSKGSTYSLILTFEFIECIATKEETDMKTIVSYVLQLVSNEVHN